MSWKIIAVNIIYIFRVNILNHLHIQHPSKYARKAYYVGRNLDASSYCNSHQSEHTYKKRFWILSYQFWRLFWILYYQFWSYFMYHTLHFCHICPTMVNIYSQLQLFSPIYSHILEKFSFYSTDIRIPWTDVGIRPNFEL